jgi:hypothetical protein
MHLLWLPDLLAAWGGAGVPGVLAVMEPEWWVVTWLTAEGEPHLFDTNDPNIAERMAVTLPETGRQAVTVMVMDPPPDMDAVKARVWKGIKAATGIDLIKEATGR